MGSLSQAGLLIYTRVVFRPNQPCVMGIIWSESRVPKGRENPGHFGTADFLHTFSRETFFEINCCPEFSGIFPEVSRRVPISPEKIGTEHKKIRSGYRNGFGVQWGGLSDAQGIGKVLHFAFHPIRQFFSLCLEYMLK